MSDVPKRQRQHHGARRAVDMGDAVEREYEEVRQRREPTVEEARRRTARRKGWRITERRGGVA